MAVNFKLGGGLVREQENMKILGVLMGKEGRVEEHASKVAQKIRKRNNEEP